MFLGKHKAYPMTSLISTVTLGVFRFLQGTPPQLDLQEQV